MCGIGSAIHGPYRESDTVIRVKWNVHGELPNSIARPRYVDCNNGWLARRARPGRYNMGLTTFTSIRVVTSRVGHVNP